MAVELLRKLIVVLALFIIAFIVFHYLGSWHKRESEVGLLIAPGEETTQAAVALPCRFVLADSYWEQMTMAVNNLLSLLRFARLWKAKIPIPFLRRTYLSGFPHKQDVTNFNNKTFGLNLNLELLFKINDFRGNPPKKIDYAPMIDYKEFIKELDLVQKNNPNQFWIFYVTIFYGQRHHGHGQKNCSSSSRYLVNPHFPGIKIACCEINGAIPTVPDDIAASCGFKSLSSFAVVFKVWRGITHPDPKRQFRMFVPLDFLNKYTSISAALPHGQYVIGNATEYIEQSIGIDVKYIGVHIRAEKLMNNHKRNHLNDTKCILNAIEKANEVSLKYKINHILYFGDGQSSSYKKLLASRNVTKSIFNPLLFDGVNNGAFIAQVEMKILSQATRLVFVGGGSFQGAIVERYKKINSNPAVSIEGCS